MNSEGVDYWKIPVPSIEPNLCPSLSAAQVAPVDSVDSKMEGNVESENVVAVPKDEPNVEVEEAKTCTEESQPEIMLTVTAIRSPTKETESPQVSPAPFEPELIKNQEVKAEVEEPVDQGLEKNNKSAAVDIDSVLRNDKVNSMTKRWLTVFTNNFPKIAHDVTFFVGAAAEKVSCHKLVLSVLSPIFQSMFEDKTSTTNEIHLADSDPEAFRSMVEYAYTGKVPGQVPSTSEGDLIALMDVTHKFAVPELWQNCSLLLEKGLCLTNAVKIYKVADSLKIEILKKKAESFIVENFSDILNTESFYDFTNEDLFSFLQCDNMIIHSEKDLFVALIRWAKFQCKNEKIEDSPENLRKILDQLVYQVYYSTMSVVDIVSTVDQTKIFSQEEFLILLKHVAVPEDDRERVLGAVAPSEQLPKPKRSICKNIEIFSKEQFSCLGDRRFNRDLFYSDAFEISKNEKRLHLMSIGFVIKSKLGEKINFHIKIVGGIAPNQESVLDEKSFIDNASSGVTHFAFKKPIKLLENKKYTVLFSTKQGQLMSLMSKDKLPMSFECADPAKSICLKFFRECGVVAALRFICV